MDNHFFSSAQTPEPSPILSEQYSDIIFRYQIASGNLPEELNRFFPQIVDNQYSILHAPLTENLATVEQLSYSSVPKLFTFIDTASLESSGILAVQIQPYLNLTGKGVLIGFLDSGIDYTHPAFRSADGRTRILRLWDQTIQTGPSPADIPYGTEYTAEQINEALFSENPLDLVPSQDLLGHGTSAAGIACGSPDVLADFTGAAPDSSLVFVKLKNAKQYLRDYFLIPSDAAAYQETDLMLGVRYLVDVSKEFRMPLVICMTLGTNHGDHNGHTPLEEVLTSAQFNAGIYAAVGTGNEAGMGHHFLGRLTQAEASVTIELLVNQETSGFALEFWADSPELYSIGFTSPLGETIQPVQPRSNTTHVFDFLLENSRVFLTYTNVEMLTGAQLAFMRFQSPSQGIWRIHAVNKTFISGIFHLWLPITGLVDPEIRFYAPNSETTLVIPSCASSVLTTSTYNAANNSLFINSGRGFTRDGTIKPDFASPGVNLTAPRGNFAAAGTNSETPRNEVSPEDRNPAVPQNAASQVRQNSYTSITGSCAASALAAGAAALYVEGGLRQNVPRYFTTEEIKSLFLRGTRRRNIYTYPNREWGYGTMNVYGTYESFLRS